MTDDVTSKWNALTRRALANLDAIDLDDDENVKMMRDTAKQIGLTQLVMDAWLSTEGPSKELLRGALHLLGEPS